MARSSESAEVELDLMAATPQKEHKWLHKLVGEWTFETTAAIPGEQSASQHTGTESVRSLGGLWILAEGRGEMPGGRPATTLMTLGYDSAKKRFVGSWIGSMMAYLWVYDGELDPTGQVLTLNAEGPSMAGDGKMAHYQDIIEFKDDDHRLLTARVKADDGQWRQFMTMELRRKN